MNMRQKLRCILTIMGIITVCYGLYSAEGSGR